MIEPEHVKSDLPELAPPRIPGVGPSPGRCWWWL